MQPITALALLCQVASITLAWSLLGAAGAGDCSIPSQGSSNWCNAPYALFNLDCDGDELKDWACSSQDWVFATSLSTENCVPRRQDGARVACAPALDALAVGHGDCPPVSGYSDVRDADATGAANSDISLVTRHDVDQPFTSLQHFLDVVASICTQDTLCVAFNQAGYLKATLALVITPVRGRCLYLKNAPLNGLPGAPVALAGSLGTRFLFNGINKHQMTYFECRDACLAANATPPLVKSAAEAEELKMVVNAARSGMLTYTDALAEDGGNVWLGLFKRYSRGPAVWEDGTPLSGYAPWAYLQPDSAQGSEDCVEANPNTGEWSDAMCTSVWRACMCELPGNSSSAPATVQPFSITRPAASPLMYGSIQTLGTARYWIGYPRQFQLPMWYTSCQYVCRGIGGTPPIIKTPAQRYAALGALGYFGSDRGLLQQIPSDGFWVGLTWARLHNATLAYTWEDGTVMGPYNAWQKGQPDDYFGNEACVEERVSGWNDLACQGLYTRTCACQLPPPQWPGAPVPSQLVTIFTASSSYNSCLQPGDTTAYTGGAAVLVKQQPYGGIGGMGQLFEMIPVSEELEELYGSRFHTLRHVLSGLCLEVASAGAAQAGTPVQVNNCTGQPNQHFNVDSYIGQILVRMSGMCLDVEDGSVVAGARVRQLLCGDADSTTSQQFLVHLEGPATNLASRKGQMIITTTAQCVGAAAAANSNGTTQPLEIQLQPQPCTSGNTSATSQEFDLVPVADHISYGIAYAGYFILRHALAGLCLEMPYLDNSIQGASVVLAPCTGWKNQHVFLDGFAGAVLMRTSRYCLEVSSSTAIIAIDGVGAPAAAATGLRQMPCNKTEPYQQLALQLQGPPMPPWGLHLVAIVSSAFEYKQCIDLPGGAAAREGMQLVLYSCSSMAAGQLFSPELTLDSATGTYAGFLSLRYAFSDLCLEDDSAGNLDTALCPKLLARPCSGQARQQFTISLQGRLVSRYSHKCIDVDGDSSPAASGMLLCACGGPFGGNQAFALMLRGEDEALNPYSDSPGITPLTGAPASLEPPSSGSPLTLSSMSALMAAGITVLASQAVSVATLVSRGAQCIDPTAGASSSNATAPYQVLLQRCNHSKAAEQHMQLLLVVDAASSEPTFQAFFMLWHAGSGRCMQLKTPSMDNDVRLTMGPCAYAASQQFYLRAYDSAIGYASIVSKHSDKCLDVPDAVVFENGVHVTQWVCVGINKMNQQFAISLQGPITALAIARGAHIKTFSTLLAMCLDVAPGLEQVQQFDCNSSSPSQVFDLLPAADGDGAFYMGWLQLRHRQTSRCIHLWNNAQPSVVLAECNVQLLEQQLMVAADGLLRSRSPGTCLALDAQAKTVNGATLTQAACDSALDQQRFAMKLSADDRGDRLAELPQEPSWQIPSLPPPLPIAPSVPTPRKPPVSQVQPPAGPLARPSSTSPSVVQLAPAGNIGDPPPPWPAQGVNAPNAQPPLGLTGKNSTSNGVPTASGGGQQVPVGLAVGAGVGGAALLAILLAAVGLIARRRQRRRKDDQDGAGGKAKDRANTIVQLHEAAFTSTDQASSAPAALSTDGTTVQEVDDATRSTTTHTTGALSSSGLTANAASSSVSGNRLSGAANSLSSLPAAPRSALSSRSLLPKLSIRRLLRSSSINVVVPQTAHMQHNQGGSVAMTAAAGLQAGTALGHHADTVNAVQPDLSAASGDKSTSGGNHDGHSGQAEKGMGEAAGSNSGDAASQVPGSSVIDAELHSPSAQHGPTIHKAAPVLPSGIQQWNFHINPDELTLGQQLGRGGFGVVYKAMWRGTPVAVKLVSLQLLSRSEIAQCKEEIKLMFRLHHPNIVQLLGATVMLSGDLAIVMELVVRGSLFALLHGDDEAKRQECEALDMRRRLRMALDMAKGIQYLHGMQPPLVHRDVKSLNMLVTSDWGIKVCDFGLTRTRHATFLSTQSPAGTPAWMAPEALLGGNCNEKSDVYSFGMVLYELFTGRLPWDGAQNFYQLAHNVGFLGHRPELPSKGLNPQLAVLIQLCWEQEGSERPTISDVLSVLRGLRAQDMAMPRAAAGVATARALAESTSC